MPPAPTPVPPPPPPPPDPDPKNTLNEGDDGLLPPSEEDAPDAVDAADGARGGAGGGGVWRALLVLAVVVELRSLPVKLAVELCRRGGLRLLGVVEVVVLVVVVEAEVGASIRLEPGIRVSKCLDGSVGQKEE